MPGPSPADDARTPPHPPGPDGADGPARSGDVDGADGAARTHGATPADGATPVDGVEAWSALHRGVELDPVSRVWLRLVQGIAAGPVARVPPDVISVAGVLVTAAALPVAAAGGRWPLLATVLVVVAGVLDGLDGAVALRTGRARPLGAVVDAMADRVADLLLIGLLVVLGAPPRWCAAAGAILLLHEYLRTRAQVAGMPGAGAVTVAERPTRVVIAAVAALGSGALPAGTPVTGWNWATVCVVGWVVVGVVGLVHLAVAVVRTTPGR